MSTIELTSSDTRCLKRWPMRWRRKYSMHVGVGAVLLLLPFLTACKGDGLSQPPVVENPNIYWELVLNHRAALLALNAPYNTLSLVATPMNAHGEPLADFPAVTYTSRDETSVLVSPEGVIRAVKTTDPNRPIPVLATLTAGNLRHVDSVMVTVVDLGDTPPPELATFSIHPIPPDSTKIGAFGGNSFIPFTIFKFHLQAKDNNDADIPNLPVAIRASNTSAASVPGLSIWPPVAPGATVFSPGFPGTVKFYASTTAFGVSKADTVEYQVGWPIISTLNISHQKSAAGLDSVVFSPSERKVGVGAVIAFVNRLRMGESSDITFMEADVPHLASANSFLAMHQAFPSDPLSLLALFVVSPTCGAPADCDGIGNITALPSANPSDNVDEAEYRVFTAPGIYEFRSNAFGARGRIIVVDEH